MHTYTPKEDLLFWAIRENGIKKSDPSENNRCKEPHLVFQKLFPGKNKTISSSWRFFIYFVHVDEKKFKKRNA